MQINKLRWSRSILLLVVGGTILVHRLPHDDDILFLRTAVPFLLWFFLYVFLAVFSVTMVVSVINQSLCCQLSKFTSFNGVNLPVYPLGINEMQLISVGNPMGV